MSDTATPPAEAPAEAPAAQPDAPVARTVDGPGFLDSIEQAFDGVHDPSQPDVSMTGDVNQLEAPEAAPEGEPEATPEAAPEETPTETPTEEPRPDGVEDETDEAEAEPAKPKDELDQLLDFDPEVDEKTGWTPKAAATFKKSKEALAKARDELATARADLAKAQARTTELEASGDNPDVSELRSRIEEYERREMLMDVEKSAPYKRLVQEPMTELVAEADEIAERNNIDPDILSETMAMSDVAKRKEALTELLADADDEDRYKVYSVIERMKPILVQRDKIYENIDAAAAEAKEIEAQHARQQAAEAFQLRQKAADAVSQRVTERLPFLSDIEGLDMDGITKLAGETDPSSLTPVEATYNSISAKLMPAIAKEIMRLQRENSELVGQLAEYEQAEPGAGGGTSPAAAGKREMDAGNFLEAVSTQLGG